MPRFCSLLVLLSAIVFTLVASPAAVRAQEVTVIAYPRIYNFPGQQLCQVNAADRRYREFCAPQSYHAFGASGYRPLGTYQPYRPRLMRRDWPSARIVQVNPE